jgi:hypothetical protein
MYEGKNGLLGSHKYRVRQGLIKHTCKSSHCQIERFAVSHRSDILQAVYSMGK